MYTLSLYNLLRKIPAGYHHQWPFFILQQQYLNKLLPVLVIAGTQVYIHSANVLHQNFKPANILINTTCHLKVLWIEIHCCTCLIHRLGPSRPSMDCRSTAQPYKIANWIRDYTMVLCTRDHAQFEALRKVQWVVQNLRIYTHVRVVCVWAVTPYSVYICSWHLVCWLHCKCEVIFCNLFKQETWWRL